jgi:toxin YoeB
MLTDCLARCGVPGSKAERHGPSTTCEKSSALVRHSDREAVFHIEFREDLRYWVESDRNVALRALQLIEAVMRDPFAGPGKPERLKYVLAGCWSRRITQEHRLVYKVSEKRIDCLQARYHY